MFSPLAVRNIKRVGWMCVAASLSGILFTTVVEPIVNPAETVDVIAGAWTGALVGLGIAILETVVFRRLGDRLRRLSFIPAMFLKSSVYTATIYLTFASTGFIEGAILGLPIRAFWESLVSVQRLYMMVYALIVTHAIVFTLQLSELLGQGVFVKFLRGQYHRAVEEERVFMFVDIRGATSLAERLGHRQWYSFLNTFFHDVSEPVIMTKAEIYQYVGDEVVITWKLKDGLTDARCLRIFDLIQRRVNRREAEYVRRFGATPEFKAGAHCGAVVSAQIGDVKKEIVYNGDVVNTTSRIQGECNRFDRRLLISGDLLNRLELPSEYRAEFLETTELRGKESGVEVYAIEAAEPSLTG